MIQDVTHANFTADGSLRITTSALTATSVTVSWSPPDTADQVLEYAVSLERVTGPSQILCPSVEDVRPPVTTSPDVTSMQFTGLQELVQCVHCPGVYQIR